MSVTPPGGAVANGTMAWTITIRLYSHPEALRTLRKLVDAAAQSVGASEADAFDLEVAVGEAVTNAYVHAYGGRRKGKVEVDIGFDGTNFLVAVHDSGKPVTDKITIPARLPEPGRGGRGLYLIGKLMDGVEIIHPDRRGRGTAVKMVKRLR